MATEAEIPESVPITEVHLENKYLSRKVHDGVVDELMSGEFENIKNENVQAPETNEFSEQKDDLEIASDLPGESIKESIVVNSEDERFSKSPSVVDLGHEEASQIVEYSQVENEMSREENLLPNELAEKNESIEAKIVHKVSDDPDCVLVPSLSSEEEVEDDETKEHVDEESREEAKQKNQDAEENIEESLQNLEGACDEEVINPIYAKDVSSVPVEGEIDQVELSENKISEGSRIEEAIESFVNDTCRPTIESSTDILDASIVTQEENLKGETNNLPPTEAEPEDKCKTSSVSSSSQVINVDSELITVKDSEDEKIETREVLDTPIENKKCPQTEGESLSTKGNSDEKGEEKLSFVMENDQIDEAIIEVKQNIEEDFQDQGENLNEVATSIEQARHEDSPTMPEENGNEKLPIEEERIVENVEQESHEIEAVVPIPDSLDEGIVQNDETFEKEEKIEESTKEENDVEKALEYSEQSEIIAPIVDNLKEEVGHNLDETRQKEEETDEVVSKENQVQEILESSENTEVVTPNINNFEENNTQALDETQRKEENDITEDKDDVKEETNTEHISSEIIPEDPIKNFQEDENEGEIFEGSNTRSVVDIIMQQDQTEDADEGDVQGVEKTPEKEGHIRKSPVEDDEVTKVLEYSEGNETINLEEGVSQNLEERVEHNFKEGILTETSHVLSIEDESEKVEVYVENNDPTIEDVQDETQTINIGEVIDEQVITGDINEKIDPSSHDCEEERKISEQDDGEEEILYQINTKDVNLEVVEGDTKQAEKFEKDGEPITSLVDSNERDVPKTLEFNEAVVQIDDGLNGEVSQNIEKTFDREKNIEDSSKKDKEVLKAPEGYEITESIILGGSSMEEIASKNFDKITDEVEYTEDNYKEDDSVAKVLEDSEGTEVLTSIAIDLDEATSQYSEKEEDNIEEDPKQEIQVENVTEKYEDSEVITQNADNLEGGGGHLEETLEKEDTKQEIRVVPENSRGAELIIPIASNVEEEGEQIFVQIHEKEDTTEANEPENYESIEVVTSIARNLDEGSGQNLEEILEKEENTKKSSEQDGRIANVQENSESTEAVIPDYSNLEEEASQNLEEIREKEESIQESSSHDDSVANELKISDDIVVITPIAFNFEEVLQNLEETSDGNIKESSIDEHTVESTQEESENTVVDVCNLEEGYFQTLDESSDIQETNEESSNHEDSVATMLNDSECVDTHTQIATNIEEQTSANFDEIPKKQRIIKESSEEGTTESVINEAEGVVAIPSTFDNLDGENFQNLEEALDKEEDTSTMESKDVEVTNEVASATISFEEVKSQNLDETQDKQDEGFEDDEAITSVVADSEEGVVNPNETIDEERNTEDTSKRNEVETEPKDYEEEAINEKDFTEESFKEEEKLENALEVLDSFELITSTTSNLEGGTIQNLEKNPDEEEITKESSTEDDNVATLSEVFNNTEEVTHASGNLEEEIVQNVEETLEVKELSEESTNEEAIDAKLEENLIENLKKCLEIEENMKITASEDATEENRPTNIENTEVSLTSEKFEAIQNIEEIPKEEEKMEESNLEDVDIAEKTLGDSNITEIYKEDNKVPTISENVNGTEEITQTSSNLQDSAQKIEETIEIKTKEQTEESANENATSAKLEENNESENINKEYLPKRIENFEVSLTSENSETVEDIEEAPKEESNKENDDNVETTIDDSNVTEAVISNKDTLEGNVVECEIIQTDGITKQNIEVDDEKTKAISIREESEVHNLEETSIKEETSEQSSKEEDNAKKVPEDPEITNTITSNDNIELMTTNLEATSDFEKKLDQEKNIQENKEPTTPNEEKCEASQTEDVAEQIIEENKEIEANPAAINLEETAIPNHNEIIEKDNEKNIEEKCEEDNMVPITPKEEECEMVQIEDITKTNMDKSDAEKIEGTKADQSANDLEEAAVQNLEETPNKDKIFEETIEEDNIEIVEEEITETSRNLEFEEKAEDADVIDAKVTDDIEESVVNGSYTHTLEENPVGENDDEIKNTEAIPIADELKVHNLEETPSKEETTEQTSKEEDIVEQKTLEKIETITDNLEERIVPCSEENLDKGKNYEEDDTEPMTPKEEEHETIQTENVTEQVIEEDEVEKSEDTEPNLVAFGSEESTIQNLEEIKDKEEKIADELKVHNLEETPSKEETTEQTSKNEDIVEQRTLEEIETIPDNLEEMIVLCSEENLDKGKNSEEEVTEPMPPKEEEHETIQTENVTEQVIEEDEVEKSEDTEPNLVAFGSEESTIQNLEEIKDKEEKIEESSKEKDDVEKVPEYFEVTETIISNEDKLEGKVEEHLDDNVEHMITGLEETKATPTVDNLVKENIVEVTSIEDNKELVTSKEEETEAIQTESVTKQILEEDAEKAEYTEASPLSIHLKEIAFRNLEETIDKEEKTEEISKEEDNVEKVTEDFEVTEVVSSNDNLGGKTAENLDDSVEDTIDIPTTDNLESSEDDNKVLMTPNEEECEIMKTEDIAKLNMGKNDAEKTEGTKANLDEADDKDFEECLDEAEKSEEISKDDEVSATNNEEVFEELETIVLSSSEERPNTVEKSDQATQENKDLVNDSVVTEVSEKDNKEEILVESDTKLNDSAPACTIVEKDANHEEAGLGEEIKEESFSLGSRELSLEDKACENAEYERQDKIPEAPNDGLIEEATCEIVLKQDDVEQSKEHELAIDETSEIRDETPTVAQAPPESIEEYNLRESNETKSLENEESSHLGFDNEKIVAESSDGIEVEKAMTDEGGSSSDEHEVANSIDDKNLAEVSDINSDIKCEKNDKEIKLEQVPGLEPAYNEQETSETDKAVTWTEHVKEEFEKNDDEETIKEVIEEESAVNEIHMVKDSDLLETTREAHVEKGSEEEQIGGSEKHVEVLIAAPEESQGTVDPMTDQNFHEKIKEETFETMESEKLNEGETKEENEETFVIVPRHEPQYGESVTGHEVEVNPTILIPEEELQTPLPCEQQMQMDREEDPEAKKVEGLGGEVVQEGENDLKVSDFDLQTGEEKGTLDKAAEDKEVFEIVSKSESENIEATKGDETASNQVVEVDKEIETTDVEEKTTEEVSYVEKIDETETIKEEVVSELQNQCKEINLADDVAKTPTPTNEFQESKLQEVTTNPTEASEVLQDISQQEKTSQLELEKPSLIESECNVVSTDVISTEKQDVPSEEPRKSEEKTAAAAEADSSLLTLSELMEKSSRGKENMQIEELIQKEEVEEEDENGKTESGINEPVMVEASKESDVEVAQKKSNNILSKVKHSIKKVKKAITGKSSKPISPK
ncbi:hypothetical protein ACFE04_009974 [Oxalis oulophora]